MASDFDQNLRQAGSDEWSIGVQQLLRAGDVPQAVIHKLKRGEVLALVSTADAGTLLAQVGNRV